MSFRCQGEAFQKGQSLRGYVQCAALGIMLSYLYIALLG